MGDFANGAQVVMDQFISSGERKWLRMSGLTLLLPHGYEGQGPEHSSARLERYLQSCAEDNMQVANCSTPANYFHVLRRQLKRDFRKPLILMTPKSLLRHKRCVSALSDIAEGTSFHRVLRDDAERGRKGVTFSNGKTLDADDIIYSLNLHRGDTKSAAKATLGDIAEGTSFHRVLRDDAERGGEGVKLVRDERVRRVVLCTGKVYYDLLEDREKRGVTDVYLMRVEQLYPFPLKSLAAELSRFRNADVVWCQEEPKNMGAFAFVEPYLEWVLGQAGTPAKRARYVGRPASASTAVGLASKHLAQLQAFLADAFAV